MRPAPDVEEAEEPIGGPVNSLPLPLPLKEKATGGDNSLPLPLPVGGREGSGALGWGPEGPGARSGGEENLGYGSCGGAEGAEDETGRF